MFSVHAIKYETLPAMLCCNDTLMGQNVPQWEREYILLMTLFLRSAVGVQNTYLHRMPYVSEQFTTDKSRTVCNAGFLMEQSNVKNVPQHVLTSNSCSPFIQHFSGCKDVRNIALQHAEIFMVDGTLVQDLNLNLNLFPPGREKSIDIFNYFNKSWLRL